MDMDKANKTFKAAGSLKSSYIWKRAVVWAAAHYLKGKGKMKTNWKKVWEEFDEWYDGKGKFDPTWNAQKRKIQQLVKKYSD